MVIERFNLFAVCFGCMSTKLINIGNKVIEKSHAAITPNAVILPRSWKGGESEKLSDRKPMAVVIDVKKIGFAFIEILYKIEARLSIPSRFFCKYVIKKCMESATASVVIIVGALAEGGVKPTPIQPPKPIAVIIDGTIRSKTANVA